MFRKLKPLFLLVAVLGLAFASTLNAADPSLVGWWKLDDGSGTTAADSSGNESHGTLNGNLEWVEGVIAGALQFDGSSGYVEIPANINQAVINKGDFTMIAWIKTTDISGTKYAFQQGDGNGTGRSWLFTVNGDIDTYVGVGNFSSGVVVELDEWYHAGFTVIENGSEDTLQMYVNGEASGDSGTRAMETCEGGYFMGSHKGMATGSRWPGVIDDVRIYNRALTADDIQKAMRGTPELASGPIPGNEQIDVLRTVTLEWTAGDLAAAHDIYLGTSFDDVNDASRANPMDVLASQGQVDASYDVTGLDFGQTYFWRVDEVNAAPDNTIFKGDVWSFTTELFAYPVEGVIATTNGVSDGDVRPENIVNGSGLDADDQHSVESSDMWAATPGDEPLTIEFEFDRVEKLHQMLVWNYNVAFELLLGFGIKGATIEYSADGIEWTVLGDVELAQGTAAAGYAANTTIDFDGAAVKYVKLIANSAYGATGKFGLSEVRFLSIPVQPSDPEPAVGATDVAVTGATLNWRAGREAASHDVYLSTDPDALALIDSVAAGTADPGALDLATTYYWRIDEVNDAEAITTWAGDVWNFTTESTIVVEDFESYTDDIDAGEAIFLTWVDGYNVAGNNSQVGYLESPFAEQTIVRGGAQAMPLIYDNAGGGISEATRTFDAPQDWTKHGVQGLVIRFYGNPANTAGTLYATINGTKVTYDGDADTLTKMPWQTWYIDLTGLNVSSVTELTIGIEGGEGTLFVDDIILTPNNRQQVTPVEPDPANLISHFAFEGDASDSTGAHPGTLVGPPGFVAGKVGQAINLNGTGDHVELTGYQGILGASAITVTAWVKTTNTATGAIMGWGPNVGGQRFGFRIDQGRLRFEHHGGNIQGDTVMNDGNWHHVAVTIAANATVSYPEVILWLDGLDDARQTTDLDPPFDLTADQDARIGARPAANDRFFMGEIDELYLYDRVLSQGEIAYQAGRTQPFDVE